MVLLYKTKMTTRMSTRSSASHASANVPAPAPASLAPAPASLAHVNTCQVKGCRHRNNHVTSRHTCGNAGCLMNGHGKMECMKEYLKKELEKYKNDIINDPCIVPGCLDPITHTTDGHSCLYCNMRPILTKKQKIKHLKYCPLSEYNEKHKIFDETTINTFDKDFINELLILTNGTYTHIYGGMGSTWFIRQDLNGKKQYFMMLTDDWGQYGKETSHMPALKSFVYGYNKMLL
jgi:hypothetical protein